MLKKVNKNLIQELLKDKNQYPITFYTWEITKFKKEQNSKKIFRNKDLSVVKVSSFYKAITRIYDPK
jgi:hypothetical protein